jgi:hypothetical protein
MRRTLLERRQVVVGPARPNYLDRKLSVEIYTVQILKGGDRGDDAVVGVGLP